ncbi:unnamed protein product [Durusdinium trenchii]|uniref:E3 ubiquitin-protein ligase ATL41 (RING-H2 finger protein ATL41) (RING-type E3 ubiquitin transferase ATL41) n=2 Tax=Durusdinium trenchii TaxID=1381693 RepID=A0ABP0Q3R0_9DINO
MESTMEPGSESTEDFSGYLLAQEVLCGFLVLSLVAVCAGLLYQALALSRLLRRERHVRQFAPRAGLGMPEADLQRLLSHPAPCGPGGEGHNECCVCLQEIAPSSPSLQLPCCSQLYHHHCILQWLSVVARCPMCRQPVRPSTMTVPMEEHLLEGRS